MQVEMKHSLACTWANVQNCSVPVLDPTLPRDLRRNKLTVSKKFGIFRLGFLEAAKMFFRYDKNVRWSLRLDVFESKCVIVLVNFLGRKITANDSAEQAGIHKCCRFSFLVESYQEDCSFRSFRFLDDCFRAGTIVVRHAHAHPPIPDRTCETENFCGAITSR